MVKTIQSLLLLHLVPEVIGDLCGVARLPTILGKLSIYGNWQGLTMAFGQAERAAFPAKGVLLVLLSKAVAHIEAQ